MTPRIMFMTFRPIPVVKKAFSILSLFSNNEQGLVYDFTDMATLYQDVAGIIPVTAVEQPIGLVLDKRLGLTHTVRDTNNWVKTGGDGVVTVVGNTITITGATTATTVSPSILRTMVPGLTRMNVLYTNTGSAVMPIVWVAGSPTAPVSGVSTLYGTNSTNSSLERVQIASGNATFVIQSYYEIRGNHGKQITSTARPILSARHNWMLNSELLTAWTKVNSTITATGAVLPTSLAPTFLYESTTTNGYFRQTYANTSTGKFTFSLYVKYANTDWVYVYFTSIANSGAWFNISAGTLGSIATGSENATITPDEDGGYIISITSNADGVAFYPTIKTVNSDASSSQTIGQQAIFTKGQLDIGGAVNPYQWITTATNYNSVGFPLYAKFDGVDDSFVTNSIDFTSTDKMMVVAGVRWYSLSTTSALAELSTSISTNNGSFILYGENNEMAYFWSKGTTASIASSGVLNAPLSLIQTGIGDISGDSAYIRLNGLQVGQSLTDQGTGNYGNYPIYIGRRAGTTFPANMGLSTLVVRGALSTTPQITNTEIWTNARTKAY